tara:strand:- start:1164 stop:2300 length:1137 start_codon:yes stop_codon:yes gene_type:complete
MRKSFSKIKILHLLHCVGGVEVYVRQITENINPDYIENIIVSQTLINKDKFQNPSKGLIKSHTISIKREINPLFDLLAIFKFIYIIIKEKPNLIHAHSAKGGVIARISSLFFKIKVFYTPHAFSFLSTNSFLKRQLYIFIEKALKTSNTFVLATSISEKNQAEHKIGYSPSKVMVLNNAIPPFDLSIIKAYPLIHSNYICTVARPSYQKNVEMLLDVFLLITNKCNDIHLFIIGAGEYSPYLKKIKKIIVKYNLESNVTILPWIARTNVLSIIKNSKIYVSTSRYEGMPYAVIESMSLKVPCVLTDVDGNRDLVKDGYNGYIIKNMDVKDMSLKICDLLENNDKRKQFGENAYAYYLKNHLLSQFIDKLTRNYFKISS